jgi:O-antigen/teichoic acid export membrane protein
VAVRRNLAWVGIGQGAFFLLQVVGTVVLARLLSPYEMGVYAIAAALMGLLGVIQAFGMGSFIIREKVLLESDPATAFTIHAILSTVLSLLVLGVSVFAGGMFRDPAVTRVLAVLALLPLIGILELLPSAQLERAGRFQALVMAGMVRNGVATLATIVMAFAHLSYLSVALGQLIGAVLGVAVLNLLGREFVNLRFSLVGWRRMFSFGLHMIVIAGVNTANARLQDIALGRLQGLAVLGLYNRATNVFSLFWENLHLVLGRVLFVDLAQRKREGQSLRGPYLAVCEMMTAVLWPAFGGLAILSRPIFHIVYGERWVPAAVPFSFIALNGMILVSITLTWELFTVSGESARQARIETFRTTLGVILFIAGSFISLTVAAATRAIESFISVLIYRPHVERMTDTSFADLRAVYLRSGLLTLLAVGPATVLMVFYRGSSQIPLALLAGVVALGVALWCGGVFALKHPLLAEAKALRRRLMAAPAASA